MHSELFKLQCGFQCSSAEGATIQNIEYHAEISLEA